jgi:hypothetical protein
MLDPVQLAEDGRDGGGDLVADHLEREDRALERVADLVGDPGDDLAEHVEPGGALDLGVELGRAVVGALQLLVQGGEPPAALPVGLGEGRGERPDHVDQQQVEHRHRPRVRRHHAGGRQHALPLEDHDEEIARGRGEGGRDAGQAGQDRAGVDRHDGVHGDVGGGGQAAGPVEAEGEEGDVDQHAAVGLGAQPSPEARREVVRQVREEGEERGGADDRVGQRAGPEIEELVEGEEGQAEGDPDCDLLEEPSLTPARPEDGVVFRAARTPDADGEASHGDADQVQHTRPWPGRPSFPLRPRWEMPRSRSDRPESLVEDAE